MKKDYWLKLKTSFLHANSLTPSMLSKYLKQLQSNDPALYTDVRDMLAQEKQYNQVIDRL